MTGSKTWITNARRSQLIALLCKTDPDATPPHRGMSILLVQPGPGLVVSRDLPKLGYKGVESCELSFDGYRAPASALLGGTEGAGFAQMMAGLETGRVQVAARAVGVARAAFRDAPLMIVGEGTNEIQRGVIVRQLIDRGGLGG